MKFVSLFAGIGGLDLGLERAGHECVGQVEIDDYATRVLEKHWPSVPRIRDVKDFYGTEFGDFDLLVGGYPCQPFSSAGSRKGVNDERHLWPHVHRIIRNVRPRLVLLENVAGHLSLGFGNVLGDLAESGYDAEWDCIPAAAVGAPHRRDRVYILAYPSRKLSNECPHHTGDGVGSEASTQLRDGSGQANVADSSGKRSQGSRPYGQSINSEEACQGETIESFNGRVGTIWATEPDVGRVADGIPSRVDRLRTIGNAVVPQVAEWIGNQIKEWEVTT